MIPRPRIALPAAAIAALLAFAFPGAPGAAAPVVRPAPPAGGPVVRGHAPVDDDVLQAIARGLRYLEQTQAASGAWIQDVGYKFNDSYIRTAEQVEHVGVTALAVMAFLAGGHLPGRGRYGDVVERALGFILRAQDADSGYISMNETRMYSHAFSMLALAEIYGMTHRNEVKEALQRATELTVLAQNSEGSWRYRPHAPDSDMSITVCQIMALRAARNIGITVPKSTIDRAHAYVDRSANRTGRRGFRDFGGFKYQAKSSTRTTFPLTAAGIATLFHAGVYKDEFIDLAIDYLKRNLASMHQRIQHYFYWYGHYYAAQVFFFASDENQKLWDDVYWPRVRSELLRAQASYDGSWPLAVGPGNAFSTAVACIILQIPFQYLPIFQK